MDLKSYTLEELEVHAKKALSGASGIVPLSPLRLISYLNNPRAEKTDHVLFELRDKGTLVAFRTLLPDSYMDIANECRRFAWLSGNYVIPEYRRRGLSTRLLQSAETHWEGKLIYTNYAPASKAVYDSTGKFPLMLRKNGKRFYLRSAAGELLEKRLGGRRVSHGLMHTGDRLVNRLRERKLQHLKPVDKEQCNIERIASIEPELIPLIRQSQAISLFKRDEQVFDWILKYPWVTDREVLPLNYEFTYRARRFENILLKFTLPGSRRSGLLWLALHNQKLSVPYLFADHPDLYPMMARTLIHHMISRNCAYTTIRHQQLLQSLMEYKKCFLTIREIPQNYFAHKQIIGTIPEELSLQDGDGDVVFT